MSRYRYAVYKGDVFIMIGTADQVALHLGVKPNTVRWWASPTAQRRADEGGQRGGRKTAIRL